MLNRRSVIQSLLSSSAVLAVGGHPARAQEKAKVGFVYLATAKDGGWSEAHDRGRQGLVAALGDRITTTVVENVPETADAERVFSTLAQDGHRVIFGTTFGYMDPIMKAAARFPNVTFLNAASYKTAPNVGTFTSRFYEGSYLQGVLAGHMSKSKVLGYVASFPIPSAYLNINAYTLGARSVDPSIRTKVVWVSTWYDPAKERQAAETLIAQGADVLAQITNSPATVTAAQEKGRYGFGWDTDMSKFAPKAHLTASTTDWSLHYTETVKNVLNGTWKSTRTIGGAKQKWLIMSPLNNQIPAKAAEDFNKRKAALEAGTYEPFTGPIKDTTGQIRVAEGVALPDADLYKMNWYVEGVEGAPPR